MVFCGLGFPKQERLMSFLAQRFPSTWFIGWERPERCCRTRTMRPNWMQRLGLEWLFRLIQEPRRLFSRYVVHDMPFACRLFVASAQVRWFGPTAGRGISGQVAEVGVGTGTGGP